MDACCWFKFKSQVQTRYSMYLVCNDSPKPKFSLDIDFIVLFFRRLSDFKIWIHIYCTVHECSVPDLHAKAQSLALYVYVYVCLCIFLNVKPAHKERVKVRGLLMKKYQISSMLRYSITAKMTIKLNPHHSIQTLSSIYVKRKKRYVEKLCSSKYTIKKAWFR